MESTASRAFIFDMDGVIVDSEKMWKLCEDNFLADLFGKEIAEKIGDTIGMSVNTVYERAIANGASIDHDEYLRLYDEKAVFVYSKASITEGIEELAKKLLALGFKLGLVSSSRKNWIDHVLPRLSFRDKLQQIISISDRPDLRSKPNPDGYLEAFKVLEVEPGFSIVLEDSNSGIQAAKAAGAYVIALRQNLVEGYQQKGADAYADNMQDVIKFVELFLKNQSGR